MALKKTILLTSLLIVNTIAQDLNYQKPDSFDFIKNTYEDHKKAYKKATKKENLLVWGGVITSTLLLLKYDQELIDEAQRIGKKLNISGEDGGYKTLFRIGSFPIQIPKDLGSTLYFLGDGIVHIGIAGVLLTHGLYNDNTKSLNVASQLAEGLVGVAITTQFLKRTTGHESPYKATKKNGKWDFFPNQKNYNANIPSYDAFPSGHLATAMMSVTVLAENYPDNIYIKPTGYTLMTLLGYQMMNNGVHWASDYPLAIAIGYVFGKIVSEREIDKAEKNLTIMPIGFNNRLGLGIEYKF